MRVAIAGKGGAGKTTIAATLARLAARSGSRVLTIDADSNPNLAPALGAPGHPGALPTDLVSRRVDGPALTVGIEEMIAEHTIEAPDDVRVGLMGMPAHAGQGCLCAAHATVSAVLADLGGGADRLTIVDMEASPEHLSRGTTRHVDVLLLVTEPYFRSLETVRRLAELAAELPIDRTHVVANKVRTREETAAVEEFCARHHLDLIAAIPWSATVMDSDVAGWPLLDRAADDPAVEAIAGVLPRLRVRAAHG